MLKQIFSIISLSFILIFLINCTEDPLFPLEDINDINSELDNNYEKDSMVVRAILNINNLEDMPVNSVSTKSAGRVISLAIINESNEDIYMDQIILPSIIGQLTALEHLSVTAFKPVIISENVWNLENLKTFHFNTCELSEIPQKIINLNKL